LEHFKGQLRWIFDQISDRIISFPPENLSKRLIYKFSSKLQKEYEAMKLVSLIDQLNKTGIVQPCKIGPDGKPVPVEHVLELAENLQEQQRDHRRKT
jgi:hypothetical protein